MKTKVEIKERLTKLANQIELSRARMKARQEQVDAPFHHIPEKRKPDEYREGITERQRREDYREVFWQKVEEER